MQFLGEIEDDVFRAYYQIDNRPKRTLPISRWTRYPEYFRWGISNDKGCLQLAWSLCYVYLIKQRDLKDKKTTAELLTDELVAVLSNGLIEKLPDSWVLNEKSLGILLIPCFPLQEFPIRTLHSSSSYY